MDEQIVLCGASAYTKKYFFNPDFSILPQRIQDELHILCVLFTEDIGGVLTLFFDREGTLCIHTEAAENDASYDEIGAGLKIRKMQEEKRELFESLELFYRVFQQDVI